MGQLCCACDSQHTMVFCRPVMGSCALSGFAGFVTVPFVSLPYALPSTHSLQLSSTVLLRAGSSGSAWLVLLHEGAAFLHSPEGLCATFCNASMAWMTDSACTTA